MRDDDGSNPARARSAHIRAGHAYEGTQLKSLRRRTRKAEEREPRVRLVARGAAALRRPRGLRAAILALLILPCGLGGAVAEGHAGSSAAPADDSTNFAGLPAKGTHASTPASGRLMLSLRTYPGTTWNVWNVYADGRMIWQKWTRSGDPVVIPRGARMVDTGYVERRLTREGLRFLRSKVLSTGLFEHDLTLRARRSAAARVRVRTGDRIVTVALTPYVDPSSSERMPKATPAQVRAVAQMTALFADPARSLPATAWADRKVRAFVPARYIAAFDRSTPDMAKLPARLRELLGRHTKLFRLGCESVTTAEARALLEALVDAGIPWHNHASILDFGLEGVRLPSDLHFTPALPAENC